MEEMRDGKGRRISNKTNVLYILLVIFRFLLFLFLVFPFLWVQHSLKQSLGCQANVRSAIDVRSGVLGFGYVVRMSGKRAEKKRRWGLYYPNYKQRQQCIEYIGIFHILTRIKVKLRLHRLNHSDVYFSWIVLVYWNWWRLLIFVLNDRKIIYRRIAHCRTIFATVWYKSYNKHRKSYWTR